MADANEMHDIIMELKNVVISDTDPTEEELESVLLQEDEDFDDIPPSLLRYFENSKSRAAACEKLILEELEGNKGGTTEYMENEKHLAFEIRTPEISLNENQRKESIEYKAEDDKQKARIEGDFQRELRKIMDAEKQHQEELELMEKRAQEKLEEEFLLRQEMIGKLQRRVEEEKNKREEEQKRLVEEKERKREEEKIKMEAERRRTEEETRRKEEEERMEESKRMKEEEMRRRREEKKREEEDRMIKDKREEEQKRLVEEKERKGEEEKIKIEAERRRMEEERKTEVLKRIKEEERKSEEEEMRRREEKKREEEDRMIKEEEIRKMKEEEEKNKREEEQKRLVEEKEREMEEEKIKMEAERRRMEEETRRKEERRREEKKREEEYRMIKEEEIRRQRDDKKIDEEMRLHDKEGCEGRDQDSKRKDREKKDEKKSKNMEAEKEEMGEKMEEETRLKEEETKTVQDSGKQKQHGSSTDHHESDVETDSKNQAVKPSPAAAEQRRLSWMKDCVSWSELSLQNRRKHNASARSRRGARRVAEAGALPALPPASLLQSTSWRTLREVTSVTLEDLPACSLSTLALCPQLQSLSLRRCGLKALEGVNQLKQLCFIDVQENDISFVDCENMQSLRILLLSDNKLSSIHGLEGVENLDILELSRNSITRIAGLVSTRRLQRLSVDHNQLISTKGLKDVYTLLHLNCSHNHLDRVEGLENNALLNTLDLRANGLTKPPSLNNQVLLRELYLDDNSISSLQGLTACWLPLMQHLSVAQNRITQLPPMSGVLSLLNLDLRFNCLSELQNLCESLEGCRCLGDVRLSGNPLQQDNGWRSALQKALPGLRAFADVETGSDVAPPAGQPLSVASDNGFLMFCQAQLQETHDLQRRHRRELSEASSSVEAMKTWERHFTEALRLAAEHRFAHEYGDTTAADQRRTAAQTGEGMLDTDCADGEKLTEMESNGKAPPLASNSDGIGCSRTVGASVQDTGRETLSNTRSGSFLSLATKCTISSKVETPAVSNQHDLDLKKRLTSALAAVTCLDAGEDDIGEEVDINDLIFDEALLESNWILPLSGDFVPRYYPVSEQPLLLKPPGPVPEPSPHILPPPLVWEESKQAWETPEQVDCGLQSVSPVNSNRSMSPASASAVSSRSERSERILEEWGFTHSHTALLMLKRAQRMKPKKQHPNKHRAMASYPSLRPPPDALKQYRRGIQVRGGQEGASVEASEGNRERRVSSCYWGGEAEPGLLPAEEPKRTQKVGTQQRLQSEAADSESARFLPEISSDVLNGGPVQLVADPGYSERQHQARGLWASSTFVDQPSKENDYPRRRSLSHGRDKVPSPQQTSSAQTKRERISFRDNPVQMSGGWGGGKKRSK
ncbi:leucine-rich repeat and IQ domain-containing protein 1 [Brachionichthys hirsutus]|uniref:leucine-rich repeat and IQ domain-containing protein 1 n=1 Tax=Brachionichthys hirsutus TaxID=412623 RepID=UPI0036048378